jgi:hypothetical protein
MHSRFVPISAIAAISLLPIFWNTNVNAADWFDGQEILIECPVWEWEPSPISGIEYELCFDDIDHCTVAAIGDSVCIPSLGAHDVWVTAIDYESGEPIFYDGDIVSVERVNNADFTGDGRIGYADFGRFTQFYGGGSGPGDLDEDGIVGFSDFAHFVRGFGKCVNESGSIYQLCQ